MALYEITNKVSDKVSVTNLSDALGITPDQLIFRLKNEKWTGRAYRNGVGTFDEFVVTGVKTFGVAAPKRKFTKIDMANPNPELKKVFVPQNIKFELKKVDNIVDQIISKLTDMYIVFYDVEIMGKDVFVGVRIKGYETIIISVLEFFSFVKAIVKKTDKKVVLVAYNDQFDSNVLIRMHNFHRKHGYLDAYSANRICVSVIRDSEILRTFSKSEKVTGLTLANLRKHHGLVDDVRFNYLSEILDVCTYDLFKEGFGGRGSLKYHGIKHGCKWSESITSDIYQYNREDVDNMAQLFCLPEVLEPCQLYFSLMAENSKRENFSIGLNLAVGVTTKKILGSKFVNDVVKSKDYIDNFCISTLESIGACEDSKTKRIFWGGQSIVLKGGVGGVHSNKTEIHRKTNDTHQILDIDFESFYPNILVSEECPVLTQKAKKTLRAKIDERIDIKSKDPASPLALKLKIFLNSIYGSLNLESRGGFKNLTAIVTALAKKYIIQALQILEDAEKDIEIIDVNTDGIIFVSPKNITMDKILKKINEVTGIRMSSSPIDVIFYSSANNYLAITMYDNFQLTSKIKGAWLNTCNASPLSNESSYNILNLADVFLAWIQNKELLPCKILKITKVSDIEKAFEILESPDVKLKESFDMTTSTITKQCESTDGQVFDPTPFTRHLLKCKLIQTGVTHESEFWLQD